MSAASASEQYKNVISCSSKRVYAFVQWLKQQDFYENTTIIIAGGHIIWMKERHPKRCLPIRKHREAREKRYSFGYAVFLILALMK